MQRHWSAALPEKVLLGHGEQAALPLAFLYVPVHQREASSVVARAVREESWIDTRVAHDQSLCARHLPPAHSRTRTYRKTAHA